MKERYLSFAVDCLDMDKKIEFDEYQEETGVCLAIQKIGQATIPEILKKLKEWKFNIEPQKVKKYCKNLQKKGLISLNYTTVNGISTNAYSLSKSIFQRDIPIAHYKDIVDSDLVKEFIEKTEEKKNASKGRKPDHCKYFSVNVVWIVKDKVLGFMPKDDPDFLQHYRDGEKIIFLPAHFRAYLGQNFRLLDKSESLKNYIGTDYGEVRLNGKKLEVVEFSILDGHQGKGMRKYEVIPAGASISTKFRVPETDFKPEEFKSFLKEIGELPIRGFGGRSSIYGRLLLKEFNVI